MVETSTAVATPSTTAARMSNGRISAGIAITECFGDLARRSRACRDEIVVGASEPRDDASASASTSAGSSPPVNSAAIDTLGDRADHDQHDARRDRLRHRAGGGEQRDKFAGFHARAPSSRETAPARPPPCRRPWRRKCRRPDTSRRAARRKARRARGRAATRGTPPWRAPCRSCRSGCRGRRTAGSTAAECATCPRPCG